MNTPPNSRLTDEELREVLARAEEIERGDRKGAAVDAEFSAVVEAGVAVGLAKQAMVQALRERGVVPMTPPTPGEMVFARSADNNYYAAKVLTVDNRGVRVQFMRGTEHTVALHEAMPFALIPGARVMVNWPWWGTWECNVVGYDATKQTVKVNDGWGETKTFRVSEVWQAPKKSHSAKSRTAVYVTLLSAGGTIGAIIGAAVTAWALLR
jgi:hypothetical protein